METRNGLPLQMAWSIILEFTLEEIPLPFYPNVLLLFAITSTLELKLFVTITNNFANKRTARRKVRKNLLKK